MFGKRHNNVPEFDDSVTNLALDRIEAITEAPKKEKYSRLPSFRPQEYFRDMIGVSRYMDSAVEHIVFKVQAEHVPYIRTKPLHHSQKEVERLEDGSATFSIDVIVNKELEQRLLSYGDNITVLSPQPLIDRLKASIINVSHNYGIL